jgi:sulfatase modifying factor 1
MRFNEKKFYIAALTILSISCLCAAAYYFVNTQRLTQKARCDTPQHEMVFIKGGKFIIGDSSGYPEERVRQNLVINDFYIDKYEVTNAQFSEFVDATGYVTLAERGLSKETYPDIDDELRVPGSAVFSPPENFYSLNFMNWWKFVAGANWRHPEGPSSSILDKEHYPVVHIALADAKAYAKWKGRELPSEAEWEYAAKAGSDSRYAWGDEAYPDDLYMANTWQGRFPIMGTGEDGYEFIAPVGCFPENNNGLLDMIGNVWEWTDDTYSAERETIDHSHPEAALNNNKKEYDIQEVHVIKGGSYLCAQNYCLRYRPAARQPQETGLGTNHLGFRTIKRISR